MKIINIFFILFALNIFSSDKIQIAIQPYDDFDKKFIEEIKTGIENLYNAEVTVLKKEDIPKESYYKKRNRYRAEIILKNLDKNVDKKYKKIVGFTKKDISTTKDDIEDWGIFGLGTIDGRSCVVSIFRLGEKKVTKQKFKERVIKVVNHELGHTFGLYHCENTTCLMEDAKGTIKTVDNETGYFCDDCKTKLKDVVK